MTSARLSKAELQRRIRNRINLFLSRSGWSRRKLSQQAGLNPSTVHRTMESNNVPCLYNCLRLCDAMGLTLCELVADLGPEDLLLGRALHTPLDLDSKAR